MIAPDTSTRQPPVEAPVKYIKRLDLYKEERPFYCFIDIPEDATDQRDTNIVYEVRDTVFNDVRGEEANYSLNEHGFVYRRHEFNFSEWHDQQRVEETYLPEVERLIKEHVEGADEVVFFDWRLRNSAPVQIGTVIDLADPTDPLRPSLHAHIDQAPSSALKRTQMHMEDRADELLRGRVRIINVWRPLRFEVEDWPLAFCDGSQILFKDLIETDHLRRGYAGANMNLCYREGQKWYYLSRQNRDEVVIFKNFDSDSKVKAKSSPHVSFHNPLARVGAPYRESIEVRALVYTHHD